MVDPVIDRITNDIKTAMKARDKNRLSVLRMVLTDLKNARVSGNEQKELSESDALGIVKSYHKKLQKSLADYSDEDKKAQLNSEIEIVAEYLPDMASEAEIGKFVDEVLAAADESNFGIIMKKVIQHFGNRADGKMISSVVKQRTS